MLETRNPIRIRLAAVFATVVAAMLASWLSTFSEDRLTIGNQVEVFTVLSCVIKI